MPALRTKHLAMLATCWLVCCSLVDCAMLSAAPLLEQRRQVARIDSLITKAGNLFRDKKFKESADAIKEAQSKLESLAAESEKGLLPQLDDSFRRLQKAHGLLELEGFTLPPLKRPADIMAERATAAKANGDPSAVKVPTGPASFVNHVAPILIAKCGRCHINDAKGMFSMADYAVLLKGPAEGKVVFPGDADGSRLIEVIASGDMPRGGLKLVPEEVTILKKWIQEGARFDGQPNQTGENLTALAPDAKPAESPQLQVVKSTGKETVSFANELAAVFQKQCTSCHGAQRPRENFNLSTFQGLLRGGDAGPAIVPGNPEESLLIKKLKGTGGGQRMPQGRPPLDDALIAKIETWIREGATFDATDPAMNIARVAALAKALRASHDELAADRGVMADANWRLAMPTAAPTRHESKNFLVFGSVGPNALTHVGDSAEALAPRVAALFKADPETPLLKGRMTLFVFAQRYDYTEFGQMVEKREIPKEWKGHWQFDVLDAYGALLLPRNKDESVDALLAHQLAATYVASLGTIPRWFAEGCGRLAAARIDSADPWVQATHDAIPQAIAASTKADDFMSDKLTAELRDVASYGFVNFLASDAKSFDKLLDALRKGTEFEQAFSGAYRAPPSQAAEVWVKRPVTTKPKPSRSPKNSPKKS